MCKIRWLALRDFYYGRRTYFGGGVCEAIKSCGFAGRGLAYESDERIARHVVLDC